MAKVVTCWADRTASSRIISYCTLILVLIALSVSIQSLPIPVNRYGNSSVVPIESVENLTTVDSSGEIDNSTEFIILDSRNFHNQHVDNSSEPSVTDPANYVNDDEAFEKLMDQFYREASDAIWNNRPTPSPVTVTDNTTIETQNEEREPETQTGNYTTQEDEDDELTVEEIEMIFKDLSESEPTIEPKSNSTIDDDERCYICLENLHEKPTLKLDCGHEMHRDCLMTWLREGNPTCPYCRGKVWQVYKLIQEDDSRRIKQGH